MEKTKEVKEKEVKQPMTPKQRTIFILKIVGNVIFYGVILALFLFSLMNINAGRKHGIPNIFGKGYLVVLTDSMNADESRLPNEYKNYNIKQFKSYQKATESSAEYAGDLLNVDMIDGNNQNVINNLKVGDVITYWDDSIEVSDGTKGAFNTHRITYVHKDENGNTNVIYTIGDRDVAIYGLRDVDAMSASERYDYEEQTYLGIFGTPNFGNIKAIVTSVNYGGAGFVNFIQQNWLFIFVIPIAIILIIEVILVIKNILDLRREKNKAIDLADHEAQMAELQNEKERMRQELLAELRAQGAISSEPKEEPKVEEKQEETPVVEPVVEEKTAPEATEETKDDVAPQEEVKEEVAEEETKPEEKVEEPQQEEKVEETIEEQEEKKEEPVVNEDEKVSEPDLSLEENDDEDGSK